MTAVPKPKPKNPHKWEGRVCKRCRLVKSPVVMARSCKAKNKFGAKTTVIDGQHFPSRLEARCWVALRAKEIRGEISNLTRKATVQMVIVGPSGKKVRVTYKADAKYDFMFETVWVEAKGKEGARWKFIRDVVWPLAGPGKLEVYKDAGSSGLKLVQVIEGGGAFTKW